MLAVTVFVILAFKSPEGFIVSGKVIDNTGNPIPFASVKVKGSAVSLNADQNGAFSINVNDENGVLVISGAGYTTVEVTVGKQRNIIVVMNRSNTSALKEVVVFSSALVLNTGQINTAAAQAFLLEMCLRVSKLPKLAVRMQYLELPELLILDV